MNLSPESALAYARALARPRRVGTGADEEVAKEIAARLEQWGYRVERQPFRFSTALTVFGALEILTGQLLILAVFWSWGMAAWVSILPSVLLLLMLPLLGRLNRWVRANSIAAGDAEARTPWSSWLGRLGRGYQALNLVADVPAAPDDSSLPCLMLVAHYDSKSQGLPLGLRLVLFTLAIASAALFGGLSLLRIALPAWTPVAALAGLAAMLSAVPLLLGLQTGNASPGAIDNASGVGLALHLAEKLSQHSGLSEKLHVMVLLTSAEEFGLLGATAYVRVHEAELRARAGAGGLYVLNLDGVGAQGKLYLAGGENSRLPRLIRQAGAQLDIPIGKFVLGGALFDHLPFGEAGFQALTLMTVGRASWWVHTPHDSADKLDVQGFRQAGEIVWEVAERLASGA
jgi:hypothetical protein